MRKMVITVTGNLDYPYNAQVWSFINGKWWYSGSGLFYKTVEEALRYASDRSLFVEIR